MQVTMEWQHALFNEGRHMLLLTWLTWIKGMFHLLTADGVTNTHLCWTHYIIILLVNLQHIGLHTILVNIFFLICELVKLILIKHYLLALVLHCTFKEKITLLMVTWHGHTSSAFMLCDEYSHSIVNRWTLSTVKIKGQSKRWLFRNN